MNHGWYSLDYWIASMEVSREAKANGFQVLKELIVFAGKSKTAPAHMPIHSFRNTKGR